MTHDLNLLTERIFIQSYNMSNCHSMEGVISRIMFWFYAVFLPAAGPSGRAV